MAVNIVSAGYPLQWRHNGRDGVSNHQRLVCILRYWQLRWRVHHKSIWKLWYCLVVFYVWLLYLCWINIVWVCVLNRLFRRRSKKTSKFRVTCLCVGNSPVTPRTKDQGAVSIRKTVLPGMAIPMLKIRRPNGRLIFNMEIAIRR